MKKWTLGFIALSAIVLLLVWSWDGEEPSRALTAAHPIATDLAGNEGASGAPTTTPHEPIDTQLDVLAAILPGPEDPVRRISVQRPNGVEFTAELAGEGKLPESFPSDLPTFPGARSAGVLSVGGEGAAGAFVAEAPLEAVYRFYHDELVADGWSIVGDSDATRAGADRLAAEKDGRQLWVTITPVGETSQIFLAIQEG